MQQRQPPLSSFYMQRQPSLSSFNMQRQPSLSSFNAASLKNKMNQAAYNARQYVSGAAGSVTGAVNSFMNPNAAAVKPNRFASSRSGSGSGSGVVGDGGYQMFTRAQLNDLYGNNSGKHKSSSLMGIFNFGKGPVDSMIMMFQLYIALIASLSRLIENASSRGISLLFGNEALINLFSVFLENALNIILNKKVGDMTLEQLDESLKANQPKLQQMSALLINAVSALAQGLSDICSKIAMEWVTKYLPGLLKSAAIGASSAAEAGINAATMGAFGEVLEIFSASAAVVGAAMKVINALASSSEDFSKAFTTVKNAYDKITELKDLFSKSPSEISAGLRDVAASATAAVIPQSAKDFANTLTSKVLDLRPNPYLSAPAPTTLGNAVGTTLGNAIGNAIGSATNKGLNKGVELGLKGISGISKGIKGAASTISNLFLTTPTGEPVNNGDGIPIKISLWNRISKSLFDSAMKKIKDSGKYGQVNATIVQYILRNPDILIPFLPIPYNVAAVAFRLVQTYIKHVYQPKTAAAPTNVVGGNRRYKNKSIKNKKHLKRYMSNLRRKTAKKELDLLNGIRDFKSMIS